MSKYDYFWLSLRKKYNQELQFTHVDYQTEIWFNYMYSNNIVLGVPKGTLQ